jgi:hypothetical protein
MQQSYLSDLSCKAQKVNDKFIINLNRFGGKMARTVGSKNRTPAELKRDAEIALAKARVKILEEKKRAEMQKKQQQK